MLQTLIDQAINAALHQDWPLAVESNLQILEQESQDIPTLNRLAYAYKQICEFKKAEEIYQKVIAIDQYNPVALKNLDLIKNNHQTQTDTIADNSIIIDFIEEPGTTKSIDLMRLGDSQLLGKLKAGMLVKLAPKTHCIAIHTLDDRYIGAIPDNLSFKLKPFITAGNTYTVALKNVSLTKASIFIREEKRGKSLKDTATFS